MFNGYGEITPIGSFCSEVDISIEHVENLSLECINNFKDADKVYLSNDLYTAFLKQMYGSMRYGGQSHSGSPGMNNFSLMTSAGQLLVMRVPHLSNFCHVGTEISFQQLEWINVHKEFEKVFFGEEL